MKKKNIFNESVWALARVSFSVSDCISIPNHQFGDFLHSPLWFCFIPKFSFPVFFLYRRLSVSRFNIFIIELLPSERFLYSKLTNFGQLFCYVISHWHRRTQTQRNYFTLLNLLPFGSLRHFNLFNDCYYDLRDRVVIAKLYVRFSLW